jgi:hypothetical protein
MQGNQIGRKFMRLAPAYMATLPHLIKKIIYFRSKQPRTSPGTTPTLNLPCFTREILFLVLRFPWAQLTSVKPFSQHRTRGTDPAKLTNVALVNFAAAAICRRRRPRQGCQMVCFQTKKYLFG